MNSSVSPVSVRGTQGVIAYGPILTRGVRLQLRGSDDGVFRNVVTPSRCFSIAVYGPPFRHSGRRTRRKALHGLDDLGKRVMGGTGLGFKKGTGRL